MKHMGISRNLIKYIKQLEQKKHRLREGVFVAEGPKVVGDLIEAGFRPAQLFATGEWLDKHRQEASLAATMEVVSTEELKRLSFLQHPQQVLAVFPLKPHAPTKHNDDSCDTLPELILALDGIQDPGNLGTIIRIADWFGIHRIVCSPTTADAWSPKVVQATMGSLARVDVTYTSLTEFLCCSNLPVCGTLLDGNDIYSEELPRSAIIVMGNEGNGISAEVRSLLTKKLLIPQFGPGAESLNVAIATAITCSEFRRRQHSY